MVINDIALVHGWGLNKAIWHKYAEALQKKMPALTFHLIDIPGYGELADQDSPSCIKELAKACLAQAPEQALWVGWSLGGMIAMQAALLDLEEPLSSRVQALQLINATPKFVQSDDWSSGVDIAIFDKFCDELSNDYERTLGMFLLLQAGASKGSRALARDAQAAISQYSNPSKITLRRGIECLANVDLRAPLAGLSVPAQVISGALDRVTKPESSRALSQMMGSELVEMHSGHAPFLTDVEFMLETFERFVSNVEEYYAN